MTWLKTIATTRDIADVMAQIVQHFHPQKVVLFGSYAYGTPTPDSDKAEGDVQVVIIIWQMAAPVHDAICFHAQQCVAKYCKAWLAERHIDFPRTHDLEAL